VQADRIARSVGLAHAGAAASKVPAARIVSRRIRIRVSFGCNGPAACRGFAGRTGWRRTRPRDLTPPPGTANRYSSCNRRRRNHSPADNRGNFAQRPPRARRLPRLQTGQAEFSVSCPPIVCMERKHRSVEASVRDALRRRANRVRTVSAPIWSSGRH
jgi:hypothetical protein